MANTRMKKENRLRNHDAQKKSAASARAYELRKINGMRLRDFMGWHCACCDRLITSIEEGWVEWLAAEDDYGNTIVHGLRLVHRAPGSAGARAQSCRYDPRKEFRNNKAIVEGLALESLVGPDGLMVLLSFLVSEDFPREQVLELVKRVHIPGYELTCNLLRNKIVSTAATVFLGRDYYLQSEMQEVIQESCSKNQCLLWPGRDKYPEQSAASVGRAAKMGLY